MNSVPDGVEVVGRRAEVAALAQPPLLVVEALEEWLVSAGLAGAASGLAWERIGEGQANLTYLLRSGDREYVLRRGPRPPHPPSTHDMLREARIQRLLGAAGVPVPHIVAVCEDLDVLGVPFYLMERVDGYVVTTELPTVLDADRRGTAFAAVDALADLHAVPLEGDLAAFGRPDGYLARQIERFAGMWSSVSRRDGAEVAAIADLLRAGLPETPRHTVVHGDFRIGNLMYAPDAPARVAAILDWEMATLGDPLADLGYFTATYARPSARPTPLELTTVTRGDGFPEHADLVARYRARHDVDTSALPWYEALALWKAAVFCEAMYTRWLDGQRPGDDFAPTLADGVPALLAAARARL